MNAEKLPANAGLQNVNKTEGAVSDVALANELIQKIASYEGGRGSVVDRVYRAVRSAFPDTEITHRRIRGFFDADAASVKYFEMVQLAMTAERARISKEAADEHAQNIRRILEGRDRVSALTARVSRSRDVVAGRVDQRHR